MLIRGQCHCGNIAFDLDWGSNPAEITARQCGCFFCVKHGGLWTSNPDAALSVSVGDAALLSEYEFATRTATFHICLRCGVVPLVTSQIDGRRYAVVNVNAFDNVDRETIRVAPTSFEGEELDSRLARRVRNWIADVRIAAKNRPIA